MDTKGNAANSVRENFDEHGSRSATVTRLNHLDRTSSLNDLCYQEHITAMEIIIKQQKIEIERENNKSKRLADILKEKDELYKKQLKELKLHHKKEMEERENIFPMEFPGSASGTVMSAGSRQQDNSIICLKERDVETAETNCKMTSSREDELMLSSIQCTESTPENSDGLEMVLGSLVSRSGPISRRNPDGSLKSYEICTPSSHPPTKGDFENLRKNIERVELEKADKNAVGQVEKQMDDLRKELESMKNEMSQLRQNRDDEKFTRYPGNSRTDGNSRHAEALEEMQEELTESREANQRMVNKISALKQENEALQKALGGADNPQSELFKLRNDLRKEKERCKVAEDLLSERCRANVEMNEKLKMLERSNGERSSEALITENAALKHQIELFKEDFENERKDREGLISKFEVLERDYEILRTDLTSARNLKREFEDEMMLLRQDNNSLKSRLHQVVGEQGSAASRFPQLSNVNQFGREKKELQTVQIITGAVHSPRHGEEEVYWDCKACTYRNPAQRSVCEMCGTVDPSHLQMPLNQLSGSGISSGRSPKRLLPQGCGQPQHMPPRVLPSLQTGDIEID